MTVPLLPLLPFAQIEMDPLSAAVQSRGMVLVVLVALVLMSVMSWVVIGSRLAYLRKLRRDIDSFRFEFQRFPDLRVAAETIGKRYVGLPHMRLVHAVLKEMHQLEQTGPLTEVDIGGLERALNRAAEPLVEEMEQGLGLLATTASAAPFIGLFGTVWGIMGAFGGLADSGTVLQSVAPHIAQALVATAVGLLAAIPASMAYNGLGRVVRRLVIDLDGFGLELLNLVRRRHLRRTARTAAPDELAAAPAHAEQGPPPRSRQPSGGHEPPPVPHDEDGLPGADIPAPAAEVLSALTELLPLHTETAEAEPRRTPQDANAATSDSR
ncbi:MAG: hypothetical protein EXR79_08380 [Myxococcales bacterium]|nr:hypothetical protein [Myxococcales bacterium]